MGSPGDGYLLEALESEGLLRACLFRYVRNPADVDDLLQETYARLLVANPSGGGEVRSVRALALTIARNVALDWLRHRNVVPIELVSDLTNLDVLDEKAQVDEIVNAHQELERPLLRRTTRGLRCHPDELSWASAGRTADRRG